MTPRSLRSLVGIRLRAAVVLSTLAGLLFVSGCSAAGSDPAPAPAPATASTPWTETLPAGDCKAGTRPAVGSDTCVAVGTAACAPGFVADASGWGCRDIQPAAACTAPATRESLGAAECVPIGDCDAPFPPANATIFVNAAYTVEQVDSKHFWAITDALGVATEGSVIAVERGTYTESLHVSAAHVTIAGRCARDVVVASPDGRAAGFEAGAVDVTVRGFTLRGHRGGVVSVTHGSATVEDCAIEKSQLAGLVVSTGSITASRVRVVDTVPLDGIGGEGLLVQHGTMTVHDSAIVRNVEVGASAVFADAKIHLEHSIVRETQLVPETGAGGIGVGSIDGATIEVVDSAIVSARSSGIQIGEDCKGTVTRSVVRDVTPDGRGLHGDGLMVAARGTLTISGTTVTGATEGAVAAIDGGVLTMTGSTIVGGVIDAARGSGVTATSGGSVTLTDVAIVQTADHGLLAQDPKSTIRGERVLVRDVLPARDDAKFGEGVGVTYGATISLTDSAVLRASNDSITVGGASPAGSPPSRAVLDHVAVLDTRVNPTTHFGRGLEAFSGAVVDVTSSIFAGQPELGLLVGEGGSHVTVKSSVVTRTGAPGSDFQHGLCAREDAMLDITDSLVKDSGGAALAFAEGSGGLVSGVLVQHNAVGLYVKDSTIRELEIAPDQATPGEVDVSTSQFVDNASRVSSDALPLPRVRGL